MIVRRGDDIAIYPADSVIATYTGPIDNFEGAEIVTEPGGMPDGRVPLADAWQSMRTFCIPEDAGEIQIKESRRVFYAAISWFVHALTAPSDSPEADEEWVEQIEKELTEFGADMVRGNA